VHVVIARLRPDRPYEHPRDIAAKLVDRGGYDATRRLVVQLLDAFTKISNFGSSQYGERNKVIAEAKGLVDQHMAGNNEKRRSTVSWSGAKQCLSEGSDVRRAALVASVHLSKTNILGWTTVSLGTQ
jgi:hypothetical protein